MIDFNKNFKVFISSPGGLESDRDIVVSEIESFSKERKHNNASCISITKWPDKIGAGAGYYGQSVINKQTANYDILICLVRDRMGTPTPHANSGTEEEFDCAIEAILNGKQVQVLLFFNNIPIGLKRVDPNQLLLVRAFREKASRLGVLYHSYDDHRQLRNLIRVSLRKVHIFLDDEVKKQSPYCPNIKKQQLKTDVKKIRIGNITLRDQKTTPQWADSHIVPLAEYRRQDIVLTWTMKTSSSYFRFGIKYYDSKEALYSTGSIQTIGQNILVHVGKNINNPNWFLTSYKAGYRLGPDIPLDGTKGQLSAHFELIISSTGNIALKFNGNNIYKSFFPIDGIAILALMAWGDEHKFQCDVEKLTLHAHINYGLDI